ncbi:MAG: DNA (cytosine-5-)-methyltransferase [Vicinamibacteria bacterium]
MPEHPSPLRFAGDATLPNGLTVVELFAGVGGFRLGLEPAGWEVVWANQWEPATKTQHAFECYATRFTSGAHVCEDIAKVNDALEKYEVRLPAHSLVVGGFPCQDYSVAKTLNQARGIVGGKGVLWWEIWRLLKHERTPLLFLENVDRLMKSPASQRGRDFAIMLASLNRLGYAVEWRVVNAADYGFPQKRRRVYIVGRLGAQARNPYGVIYRDGVLSAALPVVDDYDGAVFPNYELPAGDEADVTSAFRSIKGASPFKNAGYMEGGEVWTRDVKPAYDGVRTTLGDILEPVDDVPPEYFIPDSQLESWRYLKGAKKEGRTHKGSGTAYFYTEGSIPFPDSIEGPARTILTGEGGTTPSRFKHIIEVPDGRYRRLTPRELERLDGFPDDWTATGMPDGRRAFCMGNALVVGIIEKIAQKLVPAEVRQIPRIEVAAAAS